MPPPPPSACFGRDEIIQEVVGFVENLKPFALVGAGGIGKTSIALEVLHHDRVKERFGDNRRFIRCDKFPASCAHLLNRLSKVVGAGVSNPEDLTPLRPFLSSSEMILFLDNAESILDPAGPDAQEIYAVVEELTRFKNICLGITSRISTVPPRCKRPTIPSLSVESACDIFYGIYDNGGQSDVISDLVRQLDFHALSITLLATVASHNMWDYGRVSEEWETQRAQVLRTGHNESLAATIELSLSSQTFSQLTPSPSPSNTKTPHKRAGSSIFHKLVPSIFRKAAPSARELLEVVAFFPQGVDENNLDWLFPTVSDRKNVFDKFFVLSLTHRSNGFITMLAPIREYLAPKDPRSSPLLRATRDRYFRRLSIRLGPNAPGFGEARWIVSEDVNVEHLLDVLLSIDPYSSGAWEACFHFLQHLHWHKPRTTILRSKIEDLPDGHPSKTECLLELSKLFKLGGNHAEQKRLLVHLLELARQSGDEFRVVQTLPQLSEANRLLKLYKEGIQQAKEAVEICKRGGNTRKHALCLVYLARLLYEDRQTDAAENAASHAIDLLPKKGEEYTVCGLYQTLGMIYRSSGEREKAIHHFETAIGIATRFNWHNQLFWNHYHLAGLSCDEDAFDRANAHIEQANLYAAADPYKMASAMKLQANVWRSQGRPGDATSEASRALEVFERLGASSYAEDCRDLLRSIEQGQA